MVYCNQCSVSHCYKLREAKLYMSAVQMQAVYINKHVNWNCYYTYLYSTSICTTTVSMAAVTTTTTTTVAAAAVAANWNYY